MTGLHDFHGNIFKISIFGGMLRDVRRGLFLRANLNTKSVTIDFVCILLSPRLIPPVLAGPQQESFTSTRTGAKQTKNAVLAVPRYQNELCDRNISIQPRVK